MATARVIDIIPTTGAGVDETWIHYKVDRVRRDDVSALVGIDGRGDYEVRVGDILVLKEDDLVEPVRYFQYFVVPVRKFVTVASPAQRTVAESVLRRIDPEHAKRLLSAAADQKPRFKPSDEIVGAPLHPYFRALLERREVSIAPGEHIGAARGLDAANVIKRTVKRFITRGLCNPNELKPQVDLDVSGSTVRVVLSDDRTWETFRELCEHHPFD